MFDFYECEGQMSIFDLLNPKPELPEPEEWYQWSCNNQYYCHQCKTYYVRKDTNTIDFYIHTKRVFDIPKSEYKGDLDIKDSDRNCDSCTEGYCEWRNKNWKCKHSGHICNKENVWAVADTLNDKSASCPHICCRQCAVTGCGARCVKEEG